MEPVISVPAHCSSLQRWAIIIVFASWDWLFGSFLFLQVRICNIYFLCPFYFIYSTILRFHLFSTNDRTSFGFWLNSIEVCYCPHFFNPFICSSTLPSSPYLDCCAISIACSCLWYTDSILFSSIPGNKTAMLYGGSTFSYWRNCHMIFHVGHDISLRVGENFFFSCNLDSIHYLFLNIYHSKRNETIFYCGFAFYLSDN